MKLEHDSFYDPICNNYLIPKGNVDSIFDVPLARTVCKLNWHIEKYGKITYREYVDILGEFFDNVQAPGCFWDILDDEIPVKGFYWNYVKGYTDMEKVNGKWEGKKGKELYVWKLKSIKKEGVV